MPWMSLQGHPHPQEPVTRFMSGLDRSALLQRLGEVAASDLPAGCGEVAVAEEDAAGTCALRLLP